MKRKPKIDDIIAIHFLDHMHNEPGDKLRSYIVYGRVAKVSRDSITIDSWAQEDQDNERSVGSEVEAFTLVWAAITKVVQLQEIDK